MSSNRRDSTGQLMYSRLIPQWVPAIVPCQEEHQLRPLWIYEIQLVVLLTVPVRILACAWTDHTRDGGSSIEKVLEEKKEEQVRVKRLAFIIFSAKVGESLANDEVLRRISAVVN